MNDPRFRYKIRAYWRAVIVPGEGQLYDSLAAIEVRYGKADDGAFGRFAGWLDVDGTGESVVAAIAKCEERGEGFV